MFYRFLVIGLLFFGVYTQAQIRESIEEQYRALYEEINKDPLYRHTLYEEGVQVKLYNDNRELTGMQAPYFTNLSQLYIRLSERFAKRFRQMAYEFAKEYPQEVQNVYQSEDPLEVPIVEFKEKSFLSQAFNFTVLSDRINANSYRLKLVYKPFNKTAEHLIQLLKTKKQMMPILCRALFLDKIP